MSKSTILELRQLDSGDVTRNGVFQTILDPNNSIMLEEGDQVNVKAIYLDTAESSAGFIHLENEIQVEMEMAMYIQNYEKDQNFEAANGGFNELRQYPNNGSRPLRGDNQIWWLAEHKAPGATETNWNVTGFNMLTEGTGDTSEIAIKLNYQPITGGARVTYTSPKIKKQPKTNIPLENPFPLHIQCTGSGTAPDIIIENNDDELRAAGYGAVLLDSNLIPTDGTLQHFNLQTFPISFPISAGDYTPAEISKIITDNLANIEKNGAVNDEYGATAASTPITKTEWSANSPFLTSILENLKKLNDKDPTLGQAFVNADSTNIEADGTNIAGTKYMEYNIVAMKGEYFQGTGDPISGFVPPLDRYVGANEVALSFDLNENKLKFETIHFPIYGNGDNDQASNAVPCVEYNTPSALPGEYVGTTGLATKYSGVAFTSLKPANFWEKQLGFADICISPQYTAKLQFPPAPAPPTQPNSFIIECTDGVNMTGGFPGLDIGVQHNNLNYSQPVFRDFNGANPANTIISTTDSTSIFSSRVWNSSLADEGYFLVEVSPNFNQNMVGGVGIKSKNTMSIVNRYYTQNSFTSDQGAGSIAYTHVGEPQLLSNLNVTVRNPDRSFVSSNILQDKNTIFVEVIKAIDQNPNPKKQ